MWNLPPPAQGISPSPYLKQNLFSFDENYIEAVEKTKKVSEHPLKFLCRCCDSLCFTLGQRSNLNCNEIPIKLASYLFHPNQPFAIRVGRAHNAEYPESITSFFFFNHN